MPVYTVNDDKTTVADFLKKSSISPALENPDTLVPALIKCEGIIHYTRSGKRTVVVDENMDVERGEFLSVADVCASGDSKTLVAAVPASDYAFVMPGDNFGSNAENYLNRRPETKTIKASAAINSLDSILSTIISGSSITTPIKDVLIVSHANVGGFLFIKLRNSSLSDQIGYNELDEYLKEKNRPKITDRHLSNNANIHIRGCNIGRETRFLELVKKAFGDNVTVTAPKFLDNFSFLKEGSTIHRYEHLSYDFAVFKGTAFPNRNELLKVFQNHSPAFEDLFGNAITNDQFDSWLPNNIVNNSSAEHPCSNPVSSKLKVVRDFIHRPPVQNKPLYTVDLELDSEPEADQQKDILRDSLKNADTMKPSHAFPEYEQFGYSSYDEFIDGLDWKFKWIKEEEVLNCKGSRHVYALRIPITDKKNNLFLNALLDSGDRKYVHQQLLETDSTFFGSV